MRWPAPARNGRTASPTTRWPRRSRSRTCASSRPRACTSAQAGRLGTTSRTHWPALPTTLVGEARSCGLLGALELVEDKEASPLFPPARKVGLTRREHCIANGLVMRAVRDVMILAPLDHHGGRDRPDRCAQGAPWISPARSRHRLAPGPGAFSHARLASSLHPLGHRGRALPRMGGVALELLRFGDARRPRHPAAWPPGGATVIPRGRRGSSASWRRLWRCCRGCPLPTAPARPWSS